MEARHTVQLPSATNWGLNLILIQAVAENGATGYVRREDLWTPEPDNPQEAVVEYGVERTRSIPVYNLAGSVVGWFSLRYGGTD